MPGPPDASRAEARGAEGDCAEAEGGAEGGMPSLETLKRKALESLGSRSAPNGDGKRASEGDEELAKPKPLPSWALEPAPDSPVRPL